MIEHQGVSGCNSKGLSFCREALFPIQQEGETKEEEGEGQCGKDICCSQSSGISSPRSLTQYFHAALCPSKSPLRGLMQPVPQVHQSPESLFLQSEYWRWIAKAHTLINTSDLDKMNNDKKRYKEIQYSYLNMKIWSKSPFGRRICCWEF